MAEQKLHPCLPSWDHEGKYRAGSQAGLPHFFYAVAPDQKSDPPAEKKNQMDTDR